MAKTPSEKKTTSKKVATEASKLLRNPSTPAAVKRVSASALGQAKGKIGK
jgi:hypothetical protein